MVVARGEHARGVNAQYKPARTRDTAADRHPTEQGSLAPLSGDRDLCPTDSLTVSGRLTALRWCGDPATDLVNAGRNLGGDSRHVLRSSFWNRASIRVTRSATWAETSGRSDEIGTGSSVALRVRISIRLLPVMGFPRQHLVKSHPSE